MNVNVPRSGRNKKAAVMPRDESLWSDLHTNHTQQHEQDEEMQMRETVQAAGKDFLTVHVMGDSDAERSGSVSTSDDSVKKAASMV